MPRKGKIIFS